LIEGDPAEFAPSEPQEDETDLLRGKEVLRFEAAVASSDWTAETVISQLRKGNIFLDPDFQRRDAWAIQRKSQYIESLIIGIPTPQIILAERKEKRGSYIVIDGKQRLLSLRQFAAAENDKVFSAFRLKGLQVRSDLNGRSYDDIAGDLLEGSASDFDNATIRTVVIRSWPSEDFLYEVFLRINSGSVQLSPQELRQALHPGPFTSALNEFVLTSGKLREILGLKQPDFRMRDNEIALRYLAFKLFLDQYNGNLKDILDFTTAVLNNRWSTEEDEIRGHLRDLDEVINVTQKVFGKDAFKRWNGDFYERRINRAVFDVIAYYFSIPEVSSEAIKKKDDVVKAFKQLCAVDYDFNAAISGTTKSIGSVNDRFHRWGLALHHVIKVEFPIPELVS
jgi:hypothetical protein